MDYTSELLEKIINRVNLGIVFVDADNKIVVFNETAGDMLNIDPKEKIGASVLYCHSKASEQSVLRAFDFFRKNPEHKTKGNIVNVLGRYLEQTFYAFSDGKGDYMGVLMVFKDAEDKVSLLKQSGDFKEPHVIGVT